MKKINLIFAAIFISYHSHKQLPISKTLHWRQIPFGTAQIYPAALTAEMLVSLILMIPLTKLGAVFHIQI